MWDLAGPGLKSVSPALAGGFLTIAPPGKPEHLFLCPLVFSVFYFRKSLVHILCRPVCGGPSTVFPVWALLTALILWEGWTLTKASVLCITFCSAFVFPYEFFFFF